MKKESFTNKQMLALINYSYQECFNPSFIINQSVKILLLSILLLGISNNILANENIEIESRKEKSDYSSKNTQNYLGKIIKRLESITYHTLHQQLTDQHAAANCTEEVQINSQSKKIKHKLKELANIPNAASSPLAFNQLNNNGSPAGLVKFVDLRGIEGHPQWDSLSICGDCDTISIFIVTNSPDAIQNNVLTVNLPDGLKYCGQVGSNTTIGVTENNVSNPTQPKFAIPDMNSGNSVQLWFTVKTECDVLETIFSPTDDELFIDYQMDFVNATTGESCYDVFFPPRAYNNAINIPVLNILSATNQNMAGGTITTLPVPNMFKTELEISQNGIRAVLDEYIFRADYNENTTAFVSMSINGVDVTSKVIDNGDLLQVLVDGTDFTTNAIPLSHLDKFEEDERMIIEIVWDADYCSDFASETIYTAFYSCAGLTCEYDTNNERRQTLNLDGPDITTSLTVAGNHPTISICGQRSRTLRLNNTSSVAPILDVGINFNTLNICGIEEVLVNGVSVIGGYGPNAENRGEINFTNFLTTDPDGPGGLEDLDGDGYFDDIAAGNSVPVTFMLSSICDVIETIGGTSCVFASCTYRPSARMFYKNSCGPETYFTNYTTAWSIQAHSTRTNTISAPANLSINQDFNVTYTHNFQNYFNSPSSNCSNYSFELKMALPGGVQFNSATWKGVSIPSDSMQVIGDTLYISTQGLSHTNLTTNAPLTMNFTNLICINDIIDWNPIIYGNCNDDLPDCGCRLPLSNTPERPNCRSIASTVRIGCTCPWINTTAWNIQRTSVGYTDKTMTTKVDPNSLSESNLDAFISCDSFEFFTEGVVRGNGYDSLRLQIGGTGSFFLDSFEGTLEVISAAGASVPISCGNLTRDYDNDLMVIQDPFVFRNLTGWEVNLSNCLTQSLNVNDTVRFYAKGIVRDIPTTTTTNTTFQAFWSVYDTTALVNDWAECNAINDPISLSQYFMYGTGDINFNSFCEGEFTGRIHPGRSATLSNPNAFPNEVRLLNSIDSIYIFVEGDIDEASIEISIDGSPLTSITPSRSFPSGVNTIFVLDIDPNVYPAACTDYTAPSDLVAYFNFTFQRNCTANDEVRVDPGIFYQIHYSNLGNLENDPTCKSNQSDFASGINDIMVATGPPGPPELSIQVSPRSQLSTTTNFCFDIEVTNTGNSESFVTWLGAQNLSGAVTYLTAIRDGNTALTINNTGDPNLNQVLIDMDTVLAPTEKVAVQLCINALSCGLDTINFFTGWECSRLPEDIVNGDYGSFSCPPVSEYVSFEILDPQIQLDLLYPTTNQIPYCEEEEFNLEIKNVRQGPAFLDSLFIYLPLGEGLQVVPGSFEATWPAITGTPVPINDPVATGISDINMGNQYFLDDFSPALGMLKSLPGITGTSDSNRVTITFDVVAACGYNNGSFFNFQANGHNVCDETIFSNLDVSPALSLPGSDSLLINEYLIFLEPSLFTTCEGKEIFEINILNEGPVPSSPEEIVCITIPDTVPLVANSFNFFNPSGWSPIVSQDSVGPGINKYCFTMPAGVPDGGIFSFNFEVDIDEDTPCGIYPFFIQTLFEEERICDYFSSEEECNLSIQTSLNKEFGVNLKSSLTASNVEATLDLEFCNSAGSRQVLYELDAFNNDPINDFPSGQASIRLYADVNQNGVIDFGIDQLVGTDFINQIIPANSTVSLNGGIDVSFEDYCINEYILEFSNNAGCECGSEVIPIDVNASNLFGERATGSTCGSYTDVYDYQECNTNGILTELFGLDENASNDYFDWYFSIDQTEHYTLTDGAGNPLIAADYLSYMEFYLYFETYEDSDENYIDYYLYFEHFECSPDGKFIFTIHIPTESGCFLDFDIEVTCSDIILNTNLRTEEVICTQEDSVCINLFDYMQFEDIEGNPIDIANLNLEEYQNILIRELTNTGSYVTLENIETDTINAFQDLAYEVCLSDDKNFRIDYSGGCYIVHNLSFKLGENDTTFNLTLNHPDEICLGDTVMVIMEHSGIFDAITVQSGDALSLPQCNNLTSCDTILVAPSIPTTYSITMTDSLGCPQDTFFTINVRNTESPLAVTVDDNLICGTTETAMVCINDTRVNTILGWKKDGVDLPATAGQTCISVNEPGIYSVTAQDDLGCNLSGQNTVFIQPIPEPPVLQFGDSVFCVYDDSVIVSTVIGYESYEWFQIKDGVTTALASDVSSISFREVGTYQFYVEVTDLQGCPGQSDTLTLTGQTCFVDLMLSKNIVQQGTNSPLDTATLCDTVTYQIIVENRTLQGDSLPLDARNVTVLDSLPYGVQYVDYSATNGTFDNTTGIWDIGFLRNGRSDTLSIDAKLDSLGCIINVAEISTHDEPDIDSTPDNMDPTPEEDDEDEAKLFIEKFDLALSKVLAANQDSTVGINQDVTYWIIVENQGNIDATDVAVTDYVPMHLNLSTNDANGWMTAGVNLTNTITSLPIGTSDTLELVMTVAATADVDSTITNFAEISEAKDQNGVIRDDFDSTTDAIDNNDNFTTDNDVTGQAIQNPGADEDDHDPAEILIIPADLALVKILSAGISQNIYPGDSIIFDITIYNQGGVDAYNVSIIDYVPTGLNYSDTYGNNAMIGWSDTDLDGHPEITLTDSLVAGTGTQTVQITLQVDTALNVPVSLTNFAEITAFEDENGNVLTDGDSTPDDNDSNDGPVEDDAFMNENDDEDDHDPAVVMIDRFDLALKKIVDPSINFPLMVIGDSILYCIIVENQGSVDAYNISLVDNPPSILSVIDLNWTQNGSQWEYQFIDSLLVGEVDTVKFLTTLNSLTMDTFALNYAEITDAEDSDGDHPEDNDSTPDTDPTNDPTEDNVTDNTNGDEDDHDPAIIYIEVIDLALKKETTITTPVKAGDNVPYTITIYNQGNIPSTNIKISDYIPEGMELNTTLSPGWMDMDSVAMTTLTDTLGFMDSTIVSVTLTVLPDNTNPLNLINVAEISAWQDMMGFDITNLDQDSNGDTDPTNDGVPAPGDPDDNNIDGDADEGEDEDDSDPAGLKVFDLALKKTTTAAGPFVYGDTVTFDFTVYNQGNIPSTNIEITEYTPCGFIFDTGANANWNAGTGNTATTTITDTIQSGDSSSVSIQLILQACDSLDAWKNTGEISASEDDEGNDTTDSDVDSDADDNPDNDGEMEDNAVNGENGDEDDSDFEVVDIFDLAQIKQVVTPSPYAIGQLIEYKITVVNQGNVNANNIVVTDSLPAGLSFDMADNPLWSVITGSVHEYTITTVLESLDTFCIPIFLTIEPSTGGNENYTNTSEITESEDDMGNDTTDKDADDDDGEPDDNQNEDDDSYEDGDDDRDKEVIDVCIAVEGVLVIDAECGADNGSVTINLIGNDTIGVNYVWSDGISTTNTANNLSSGIYTVTLSNGIPTCNDTLEIIVGNSGGPIITIDTLLAAACPNDDGSATISWQGGMSPYAVSIDGGAVTNTGASTFTFNGLSTGMHSITVVDANGCMGVLSIDIEQSGGLEVTATGTTNATCGLANAVANLTVQPAGTYTYTWSDGASGDTRTDLVAGIYDITVSGADGCTGEAQIIVNNSGVTMPTVIKTDVNCANICDGSIIVTAMSGTHTVYDSDNEIVTTQATGGELCAGDYMVEYTDVNGCMVFEVVTIIEPEVVDVFVEIIPITCEDGKICVTNVLGGDGNYTYAWMGTGVDGLTDTCVTITEAGLYTLVITDGNGCEKAVEIPVVDEGCCFTPEGIVVIDAACGEDNGSVTIDILEGAATAITYTWSDNVSTTATANNLSAGTYAVTIANGLPECTQVMEIIVGNTNAPNLVVDAIQPTTCPNDDGSASVSWVDGIAPYAVSINGGTPINTGGTTQTFTNLAAGTHDIEVIDANGCKGYLAVVIEIDGGLTLAVDSSTDADCGVANGTASISVTPTGTYTYTWSDAGTGTSRTDLASGVYTVTASDANGCTGETTIVINDNSVIMPSLSSTNVNCTNACDGSITLPTVTGTFAIEDANGTAIATALADGNLCAGTYYIQYTDATNCNAFDTITITQPDPIDVFIEVIPVTCADGEICITNVLGGSGNYTYTWSGTGIQGLSDSCVTVTQAGVYSLNVMDENGCDKLIQITVSEEGCCFQLGGSLVIDADCGADNGSATIDLISGDTTNITYTWSDGVSTTRTANNLSAGIYTVTIENGMPECTQVLEIPVGNNSAPNLEVIATNPATCPDDNGSVMVTWNNGTAPFAISIDGAAPTNTGASIFTFSDLAAGNHSIKVIDANGCEDFLAVTIEIDGGLTVTVANQIDADCNTPNGAATLSTTPTGTYTYTWSDGGSSSTRTDLASGIYTVTVSSTNGCTEETTVVINDMGPTMPSIAKADVSCFNACDGRITLVTGAGTFTITDEGGNDISLAQAGGNLCAGQYILEYTEAGCSYFDTIQITQPEAIDVYMEITPVTCSDGVICVTNVLGGNGNYSFTWSGPGISSDTTDACLTVSQAGTYTLSVMDSNGCGKVVAIRVVDEGCCFTPEGILVVDAACGEDNGSVTIDIIGGNESTLNYTWSDNISTTNMANNLSAGIYFVTIENGMAECTQVLEIPIGNVDAPNLAIESIDPAICPDDNGSVTIIWENGTAPFAISIDGGTATNTGASTFTFSNLTTGTHAIKVVDADGCEDFLAITIETDGGLEVAVDSSTDADCGIANGTATITVTPAGTYTYAWSDGGTGNTRSDLASGIYIVTASDTNGCEGETTVVINNTGAVMPSITSTNVNCINACDGAIMVTAGVGIFTITDEGGTEITLAQADGSLCAGQYIIEYVEAGCSNFDTVQITQPEAIDVFIEVTPVTCSDGKICITNVLGGTGAYTYTWSGTGIDGLTDSCVAITEGGIYTLNVMDENGCNKSVDINIADEGCCFEPEGIVVIDAVCGDNTGMATVNITSGDTDILSYNWSGNVSNSNVATNLSAGIYSVTIENGMAECTQILEVAIGNTDGPNLNISAIQPATCPNEDGSVSVNWSGAKAPYEVYLNNTLNTTTNSTTHTFANLASGNYSIELIDSVGCKAFLAVTIETAGGLAVSVDSSTDADCGAANGTATISVIPAGTYTYTWSDGGVGISRTDLSSGIYTVTAADAIGCTGETTIIINNTGVTMPAISKIDVSCHNACDGSIILDNSIGIFEITNENGNEITLAQTNGNLCAGEYYIEFTDTGGCQSFDTLTIDQPEAIDIYLEVAPIVCRQGKICITEVTGGSETFTYLWSGTDVEGLTDSCIVVTQPGYYTLTVSDGNGCDKTIEVYVEFIDCIVDLALKKTATESGPFVYGDTVTYNFTVYNQGNLPATNIDILEQTPCGFSFDASINPAWIAGANGTASTRIIDTLEAGDSSIVAIDLILQYCSTPGAYNNQGEITHTEDELGNDTTDDDVDSKADENPNNDGDMKNDETENENGDEDDSDFEEIEIFDLALTKNLKQGQFNTVYVGNIVEYELAIHNQGNITAYDIEVTDYAPASLVYEAIQNTTINTGNDYDWTVIGGNPTYVAIDSLQPFETTYVTIRLRVDPNFSGGDLINYAEISHACIETDGANAKDADSDADDNNGNDNGGDYGTLTDNNIDGDGTIDEDDHDPAKITTIANYAVIVDPCTCLGGGLIGDKVAIYSTKANEIWALTVNTGMYNANSTSSNLMSIPLGTTANYVGIVNGLHRYELPLIHLDGIGYTASFTNGTNTLSVANICSCPTIPTDPDGTPVPPDSMIVVPMTKTPVENTLSSCDGIPYISSTGELYVDTAACRIVQTICPTDQWKQISFNFSEFELAAGDTLCVFEGNDTTTFPIAKWSGVGVSQTSGWISSHCSPTVNPSGCLTFLFKTNGDNNKGTGWKAEVTCDDRGVTLNATDQHANLTCEETFKVFTIESASIAADCGSVVDSQIVRVFNALGELCKDTCLAATDSFDETFGLGTYMVEYKLKSDTVKQTRSVLTVSEAPLVCNDRVNIPLGSSCSIFLTPDDLLEGPCDTITDSVYYFITLKGVDKNGQPTVLATGGGKGGNYPAITKEMIDQCGGTITTEIEKRYYDGLNLTFCNNGPQGVSCEVEVEVMDQTIPFFTGISTIADTFRLCGADLTPENLGIPTPTALDNCTEASVEFTSVNVLTDGGTCDTTRAQIIWTATDACGNTATASQSVVILRPEITDIVLAPNTVLSCGEDGTEALNDFDKAGVPSIQVGKVVNGVLVPTDTIALDTANYICGYILQKTDVRVAADCGIKVFRSWDVLDWCDSANGPQPLATQFIELRDTLAPTFVDNILPTRVLDLPHDACRLDITTLDHPSATDNCSAVSVRMDAVFRIENGTNWQIEADELTALDCDSFLVQWVAEDACHEQLKNDTITQLILIEDNTAPSAACVDKINLSLGQNDAKLHYSDIDGGSYDACGIVTYEVSRDEENWDSTVIFTCEDAHAAATVYLRVTDSKGNQSTCWMTVNVEDKIAPICSDLPDMTENCDELHLSDLGASTDTNDNGLIDDDWVDMTDEQIELFNAKYGNPNCSDNITCNTLIVQQQYQLAARECGRAAIQRRFRAIDWDGQGRTSNWATQNINIESTENWSVTLPSDWKGTCGDNVPSNELNIVNGACDLIAYEVEEKVFTITEDACLKVVRTFTIINWCNYEAGQPATQITRVENEHGMVTNARTITSDEFENVGKLEYIQILKLQDDTAPVITLGNVDNCIESADCKTTKRFAITANDCNTAATIDLAYNWTISTNGTQLATGEGSFFNYEVAPNVNYEVEWTVVDKCGNTAKETANYEFSDCRKPAPYCLHGTAVELMSTGMIQVWAEDFERGSTDNCTPTDKLAYRIWHANLGEAPTDLAGVQALPEVLTFDCATLGQQNVNFYVIDEAGNWDFCTTYVIIQDNMNACQNTGNENTDTIEMAVISGIIMDWKQKTVEEVQVSTSTSTSTSTQADGFYNFELAMNNPYTIVPKKNQQPLNGVSTFDLVLISKHILGITEFDNPYQMIAADANNSRSITAFDMVQIRQLILNIKTEFTNNESWRFVDAAYEFTTDQPLSEAFPEVTQVADLRHDMQIDFVAVKVGDVNGNARTNSLAQAEDRTTANTFEITTEDQELRAGQTYTVEFNTTQLADIQGYQFTLGYEDLKLEKLNSGVAGVENFGLHKMDDGMITTSWNSSVGSSQLAVGSGQPSTVLFNIKFTALKDGKLSEQLSLINRPTVIEAYSAGTRLGEKAGELMDVQLTFTTPLSDTPFELFQNQPNPFHDKTIIGFNLPGDAEVELVLRDETGRVLKTIKQNGIAGYNTIQLEIEDLSNGFIYYQLSTKFGTKAKKMIQLK